MIQNRPSIASRFCLLACAATLGACATGQDLRETSKKFEGQTTSLEAKIEQLKQTQHEAEKSLVKMEQLIEDNQREQSQTRELAAKLNSDLRSFREMDLTKVEGRIELAGDPGPKADGKTGPAGRARGSAGGQGRSTPRNPR